MGRNSLTSELYDNFFKQQPRLLGLALAINLIAGILLLVYLSWLRRSGLGKVDNESIL